MSRIIKQPDIRRKELLDIGIELYFKLGEKGVSIQKIVQQANVATGLFYYYFKSKDEFLNEALNTYIDNEIYKFEVLLKDETQNPLGKLDAVFDVYSEYAKKMAPFRSSKAFHSERHYVLTVKLTKRLCTEVCQFIRQGILENIFKADDVELTSKFIVGGLTSIFDEGTVINDNSLNELKRLVNILLKGEAK